MSGTVCQRMWDSEHDHRISEEGRCVNYRSAPQLWFLGFVFDRIGSMVVLRIVGIAVTKLRTFSRRFQYLKLLVLVRNEKTAMMWWKNRPEEDVAIYRGKGQGKTAQEKRLREIRPRKIRPRKVRPN